MIMSNPTPPSVARNMDEFIDFFEAFDERIFKRNKATYVKTSDRIALFAIYYGG